MRGSSSSLTLTTTSTTRTPTGRRPHAMIALLMALGMIIAACGSDDEDLRDSANDDITTSSDAQDVPAIGEEAADAEAADPAEPRFPEHVTFADYGVGGFVSTDQLATSTFATDADTASYSIAKAWLENEGVLPPAEAIRAEEFINAIDHRYPDPANGQTWNIMTDVGEPWWDSASSSAVDAPAADDTDPDAPVSDHAPDAVDPGTDVVDPASSDGASQDPSTPHADVSPEPPMTEEEMDELIDDAEPMPMPTVPEDDAPHNDTDEAPPAGFADGDTTLLRVGMQGERDLERTPVSVTLAIDTSGSMSWGNRVDLVEDAVDGLLNELTEDDQVGVVEYGTNASTVAEHTNNIEAVRDAVASLEPNGSTNAEAGLVAAYDLARQHYREDVNNVVVFFSDGVANVGETDSGGIMERIGDEAADGIMLHSVGVGLDNFNDVLLERLANDAGGAYAYIDHADEALELFTGTLPVLTPLAHDVKAQVEFDDEAVQSWRLVGYENRLMHEDDFRDEEIGGGYVGAGHSVTALYEVVADEAADDWGTVTVRWADPHTDEVSEVSEPITPTAPQGELAATFDTAAAMAATAEYLRGSPFVSADLPSIQSRLESSAEAQDADVAELVRDVQGADQPGSAPRQEVSPPGIEVENHTN